MMTKEDVLARLDWHLRRVGNAQRRAEESGCEPVAAKYFLKFEKLRFVYDVVNQMKERR